MTIAVLSDIHANYQALEAVVADARNFDPEIEFWFLGDFVGRGPDPAAVFDKLNRIKPSHWLVGNWDRALVGKSASLEIEGQVYGEFKQVYYRALEKQRRYLQDTGEYEQIAKVVGTLPELASPCEGIYLAHGSFFVQGGNGKVVTEYLWPSKPFWIRESWVTFSTAIKEKTLPEVIRSDWSEPVLLINGHTHEQAYVNLGDHCAVASPPDIDTEYPLTNDPRNPLSINPGSVGYSRHNGGKPACYAILELSPPGRVIFRQVPYNRRETCKRLETLYNEPEFKILRDSLDCTKNLDN